MEGLGVDEIIFLDVPIAQCKEQALHRIQAEKHSPNTNIAEGWFIVYVCILSTMSAVIDIRDALKYVQHGESLYKRA